MIEAFAGFALEEDAFCLAVGKVVRVDRAPVTVAEVDLPAGGLGNAGGEGHAHAGRLDAGLLVVGADAVDVRRVGEGAPGLVLELVPLLQEIIAAVVADLADVRDWRTINPSDYANREAEGVLLVPKAGERLFHLRKKPAWAGGPA